MTVSGERADQDQPTLSVVIPAFNAAGTLGEQLEALARQTYRGRWEAIVADNGSSDATRELAESFRGRIPGLRVIDASIRRGAAAARNIGAGAARGEVLAFCDADDVLDADWLLALAKATEAHAFVAGAIDHETLNPDTSRGWAWRSHVSEAPLGLRFKPYALSSNMAVHRGAFEEVGGFPEDLNIPSSAAGEDIAISWSLQLAGHELHFEPTAIVAYRHRHGLRDMWRQHYSYGFAEPVLYKRFRHVGVPSLGLLSMFAAYGRLIGRLPRLLRPATRPSWIKMLAKRWGRLRGSIRERVLYL